MSRKKLSEITSVKSQNRVFLATRTKSGLGLYSWLINLSLAVFILAFLVSGSGMFGLRNFALAQELKKQGGSPEFREALKYYLEGDYSKAQSLLGDLLKKEWQNYDVVMLAAYVSWKNRQQAWAIANFEQAKKLAPQKEQPFLAKTEMFMALSRWEMAKQELTALLRRFPRSSQGHLLSAKIALQEKKYTLSIARAENALKLDPEYAEAYNILGLCYLAQKKVRKSYIAFKSALSFDPDSATLHNNVGVVYEKMGKLKEAQKYFEKTLELNPAHPTARLNLERIKNRVAQ